MCNATITPEQAGQVSSQTSQPETQVSKRASVPAAVGPDAEYFAGVIKSYNERRGFGFLACDETAKRFGRDVYLSKVESLAALRPGEPQLKEGDHVMFAVVLSVEGFPQAAAAQRLYTLCGRVLNFCKEQGGKIICAEGEVRVQQQDCGYLLLHPGDEVSFCLARLADGTAEAKLVKLVSTARPLSSMLGCFSLEFPQEGRQPVLLDAHAFSSCICFSGLPTDLGEAELSKFFVKLGASQVTVANGPNGAFASVFFPDVNSLAQFLAVGNHSFTEEANTVLVQLKPCRAGGAQTLPALAPPSLVQGDIGGVLVCWEPVSLAAAYKVEIRTSGAGTWSPVDAVGRVQPVGANPILGTQTTCLAVADLSAGLPYEARVSYVTSCGCHCAPSDPSCTCSVPAPPPMQSTHGQQTPPMQSTHGQQVPMPPAVPCPAEVAAQVTPMMQLPPPLPAPQMIVSPLQPEVRIADQSAGAVCVRWSGIGFPATAYMVELRQGSTGTSSRFACQAPADGAGSLELCIQGLQPGQSYTACIRSVAREGFESAPSPWSAWVTLPDIVQSCSPTVCGSISTSTPQMPSPPVQQLPPSPYSILFDDVVVENPEKNQFGMVKACFAPEMTGHEDALFLD
eukprot:gnl/MRDRNA2_/MRDRNA2_89121_c0_seq1.p1 gnl/MRDRNA2_/MRDRNA2_89121_c0~~gnl/MRDRNA2_/MRDRNA2_89121_c0_seq1.p1  ORF type:complete len:624 (-),score=125.05 gnl/MRDRNA2_/MRDRNA2_89121_c0_seq1:384-2255(-)